MHITINCLLSGDHADRMFPIKINKKMSVMALKHRIKTENPNRFEGIDANDILLFRVELPNNDELDGKLETLKIDQTQSMLSVKKISNFFPSIPKEHLHVIVVGAIVTLNCLISGEDAAFPIKIAPSKDVFALKKSIKQEQLHRFANIDAVEIKLFKTLCTPEEFRQALDPRQINGFQELTLSFMKISALFQDPLQSGHLHIVVFAPTGSKRPRPLSQTDLSWPQKRQNVRIPSLQCLAAYLLTPLSELEKIPVTKSEFSRIVNEQRGTECCRENDVLTVFRIIDQDDDSIARDAQSEHFVSAMTAAPPTTGTEDSFISTWDRNIRTVLEQCEPSGTSIRNSNKHTNTLTLRPDYGFLIGKTCPFRGEEKEPGSSNDPRLELSKKLVWMYNSIPYLLAYHAIGTNVSLVALTPPQTGNGSNPGIHDLVSVNLQYRRDRLANLLYLINLSALLSPISRAMDLSGAEFDLMERVTCTIELTSSVIIKTYQDAAKVAHLRGVYNLLEEHHVPNIDNLAFADEKIIHLVPRGIAARPETKQELRDCVRCVLEALVVLHNIPLYHRDIRLDNVVRRIEDPSLWFLIDWEDSSGPETKALPHVVTETHSPDVLHDNHGAEVDIWGVGFLIRDSTPLAVCPDMGDFGKRLQQESKTLTAAQALQQLNNLS